MDLMSSGGANGRGLSERETAVRQVQRRGQRVESGNTKFKAIVFCVSGNEFHNSLRPALLENYANIDCSSICIMRYLAFEYLARVHQTSWPDCLRQSAAP